jgi:hypothetical protein
MLDDMIKMDAGLDARQIVTQIDAIIPEAFGAAAPADRCGDAPR